MEEESVQLRAEEEQLWNKQKKNRPRPVITAGGLLSYPVVAAAALVLFARMRYSCLADNFPVITCIRILFFYFPI